MFVAATGDDHGAGTEAAPLRTISAAMSQVAPGGTVVVRAGSYHEQVKIPFQKVVRLQAYPYEAVWLDGAETVDGWVADAGAWYHDVWTFHPDTTDPTAGNSDPQFRLVSPDHPVANDPQMVFIDGAQRRQVGQRDELGAGAFYVDTAAARLWIGDDPNGHLVEASSLTEALYINGGDGSQILGIGVRRYATPLARYGAVKAFANDVLLENVHVADNATEGVGLQGSRITLNQISVQRNGQLGIGGTQSDDLTLRDSLVSDNNTEQFKFAREAGGMKLTTRAGFESWGTSSLPIKELACGSTSRASMHRSRTTTFRQICRTESSWRSPRACRLSTTPSPTT